MTNCFRKLTFNLIQRRLSLALSLPFTILSYFQFSHLAFGNPIFNMKYYVCGVSLVFVYRYGGKLFVDCGVKVGDVIIVRPLLLKIKRYIVCLC